jgi:hypothetical protein
MYNGGNSVRAYRPGNFVIHDEVDELAGEVEKARRANVIRYAARVSAGLSVFGNSRPESQDDLGSLAM